MTTSQRRSTGKDLVQQLMKSMSMTVPTTVAGATDKRSVQFWQLATDAGQMLAADEHKWQVLKIDYTLATQVGVSAYNLPTDFNGFESDSTWNRTTRMPVLGSLREFEWQMLKARNLAGTTFTMMYRIVGDQVVFYDTPTSIQTIALPYTGRGWVQDAVTSTTRKDNLEVDGDIVLFDPQLFKAALKLCWYREKGFNTTNPQAVFDKLLRAARGADVTGRTLSLAGGGDYPYLGILNVPDSGLG